jgi:hypothetical protein
LIVVEAAAAELPTIGLDDALAILVLLAQAGDARFDRAAARWVGRLLIETPAGLSDARFALALVERPPGCRDALSLSDELNLGQSTKPARDSPTKSAETVAGCRRGTDRAILFGDLEAVRAWVANARSLCRRRQCSLHSLLRQIVPTGAEE